jgi:membrane protease YdiL (CAAX protease family)
VDLPPDPPEETAAAAAACVGCGAFLKPESRFCPACGHRRGDPPPAVRRVDARDVALRTEVGLRDIRAASIFYAVLLASQAVTALVRAATSNDFTALVVGSALLTLATLGFAARRTDLLLPLYRRVGFGPPGLLLVVGLSIPVYLAVHGFVTGLSGLFRIRLPDPLEEFAGRSLGWAALLIVAAPAIVEELGFRGLVFGLLRRRLPLTEALLISSFAFGALHMSIPSLITHVPLGLYLGWLRHRSGSLWPPMLAHALHNGWFLIGHAAGFFDGGPPPDG